MQAMQAPVIVMGLYCTNEGGQVAAEVATDLKSMFREQAKNLDEHLTKEHFTRYDYLYIIFLCTFILVLVKLFLLIFNLL